VRANLDMRKSEEKTEMILTFCWVEKGNEKLDHAVACHSGGNGIKRISSAHGSTAQSYRDKTIQKPSFLRETLWFLNWLGRNLGCCQ